MAVVGGETGVIPNGAACACACSACKDGRGSGSGRTACTGVELMSKFKFCITDDHRCGDPDAGSEDDGSSLPQVAVDST